MEKHQEERFLLIDGINKKKSIYFFNIYMYISYAHLKSVSPLAVIAVEMPTDSTDERWRGRGWLLQGSLVL